MKRLIERVERPETIILEDDRNYVVKGMPDATLNKAIRLTRSGTGRTKPILMLSIEDAFDNAENGNGTSATYRERFGGPNFFNLLPTDESCVIENIDICPPIDCVPGPRLLRKAEIQRDDFVIGALGQCDVILDSRTARVVSKNPGRIRPNRSL